MKSYLKLHDVTHLSIDNKNRLLLDQFLMLCKTLQHNTQKNF